MSSKKPNLAPLRIISARGTKPGTSRALSIEDNLKQLIASLNVPWGRLQLPHIQQEQDLLESFAQGHSNTYNFSSDPLFSHLYRALLQALIKNRIMMTGFPEISPPHLYLGSVQCLRLLTRDANLLREFDAADGLTFLSAQLKALTVEHFGGKDESAPFTTELLIELASIIKKFTSDKRAIPRLVKQGLHATFSQLLYSRESALLPLILVSLTAMAKDGKLADQLAGSDTIEILIRMIDEYGDSLKSAAADLLNLLCRTRRGRGKILQLEGVSVLLQQLHAKNAELVSSACKILHCICLEPGGVQEIRQVGGIPIITNVLRSTWLQTQPPERSSSMAAAEPPSSTATAADGDAMPLPPPTPCPFRTNDERTFQLTACCAVLTRLSEDADCAVQIVKCNGIYWLGRILADPLELGWTREAEEDVARGAGDASTSARPPRRSVGGGRRSSLRNPRGSRNNGRRTSTRPSAESTTDLAALDNGSSGVNTPRISGGGGPPPRTSGGSVSSSYAPPPRSARKSAGGGPGPGPSPPPTVNAMAAVVNATAGDPDTTDTAASPAKPVLERRSSLVQKIRGIPANADGAAAAAAAAAVAAAVIATAPPSEPVTPAPVTPAATVSPAAAHLGNPKLSPAAAALDRLWLMALRALRFLFSLERNRKFFKSLLPADIFFSFIDVGHYEHDVEKYRPVAAGLEALGPSGGRTLRGALEDINTDRLVQDGRRVRGYMLLEVLGRGAFGCVYKAKRLKGETMVAVKEVALEEAGMLLGATDAERQEGLGQLCHEIAILSQMQHPNIVKYHESFVEGRFVFIVMELMEGVSLMDHINRQREMNAWLPEEDVWQIVISMVTAMNYLHSAQGVVHRDVTPNNIVLGQGQDALRRAKLTDFGLARQKMTPSNSNVIMQSMVGTMAYACPEIIQGEPYSEKADVWSLGCVLYHCVMRRPPFEGSNPLAVATRIVEGEIDPIADPPKDKGAPYSPQLKGLIAVLLTPDPQVRPGIQEVAALIAPRLLLALDRSVAREDDLQRAIEFEKQRRKHSYVLYAKKKELFRKLLHEVQSKAEDRAIARVQAASTAAAAAAGAGATPRPQGLIPLLPPTPRDDSFAHPTPPPGAAPTPGVGRGRSNSVQRNMSLRVSVPPGADGLALPPILGGVGPPTDGTNPPSNGSTPSHVSSYGPPSAPLLSQSSLGVPGPQHSFTFFESAALGGSPSGDASMFFHPPSSAHVSPKLPGEPSAGALSLTARSQFHSTGGSDLTHLAGPLSDGAPTPGISPHDFTWPAMMGPISLPPTARGATPPSGHVASATPHPPNATQPLPSARGRVPGRTIAIAPDRLRPVADPVAEVLQLVMKIRFVENAPPGSVPRDWRHRCIQKFSKQLFVPGSVVGQIKTDLAKLVAASPEIIDMDILGRPAGRGSRPPSSSLANRANSRNRMDIGGNSAAVMSMLEGANGPTTDGRISYETLLNIIESVCEDMGFSSFQPRPSSHLLDGLEMVNLPAMPNLPGLSNGGSGGS